MEPVILVHGYSAEGASNNPADVARIFGNLHADLKTVFPGPPVLDVNISRYISLDDGVDLDDITLAFDRALKSDFPALYKGSFNAIVHSTGALVLRNWVRRFSGKPSQCRRIVHLAGANLGSGWAHVGETLLAKWWCFIGERGKERGLAVLDGLELGSNWTLELHRHFLSPGNSMLADYGVMEFSLVGSQPSPRSMIMPIRYGREDGSDGVVRVAASNLNHHYVQVAPSHAPEEVAWNEAVDFSERTVHASAQGNLADYGSADTIFAGNYYTLFEENLPGERPMRNAVRSEDVRPIVPFAIPYFCAHSSEEMGIVSGAQTRSEVLDLIRQALTCADPHAYARLAATFNQQTENTYANVGRPRHIEGLQRIRQMTDFLRHPEAQYDRHAQVSVRVRDQYGNAIDDCSIHFNSFGGGEPGRLLINELFEDTHKNRTSPDTTTFYLRLESWDGRKRDWLDRLALVNGVDLEIDCIDPRTERVVFVPLRMRLNAQLLARYLKPHRATVFDVILQRLPAQETFSMYRT